MNRNILKELKNIIPNKYTEFNELTTNKKYYFKEWDTDKYNEECLYYWFYSIDKSKKNTKRVVIRELVELLDYCKINNIIKVDRQLFADKCNITYTNGPCGYCVSIRMLEFLNLARYKDSNGFEIIVNESTPKSFA